ncbi:HEAT repeat-containing protein 2 [Pleodorina starrii]|uniref:HEAT repeat-containing protein 2 n=1 Tax=Pleodorina starrii TaxID=330485 RepID=A0A9W6BU81_9CHLO|nr:HEAT repeat-containing protein 2 [Pleodorina starrii]GLC58541.1 HEAT repeat-containing protein 2 [Pleodorina starrii]GLC74192.1 HEAT repeat-containing protein 2 [Pleodorina starrii]
MSGQKKSVDEIWKELNAAKPKPRQGVAGLAVGLSGLPGITSVVRTKPSASATAAAAPAPDPPSATTDRSQQQSDPLAGPYVASAVGPDAAAYLASLQRTINCLADPDRGLRRTAATTLQTKLFTGDASTPKASPAQLQALLCGPLLRPLVAMLSDSVERCRTVALAVLLDGSRQLSDVSHMLPELVPELARRYGTLPVQEPAEEVRLQIAQLVALLLAAAPAAVLARFAPEVAAVVCRSLEDGFPDIKKAGCAAIETAASRLPLDALAPEFERLLNSLAPNLQHQHSRVRLSSIQALDALVAAGAPMALVEDAVVTALRPVGHDRAQPVREAAFAALSRWMGYRDGAAAAPPSPAAEGGSDTARLPPQAYVPSLLPLLIIGVTDPQPATAELALRLVEGVGEAWAEAATAAASGGGAAAADIADADSAAARVQELVVDPAVSGTGDGAAAANRQADAGGRASAEADGEAEEGRDGWRSAAAVAERVAACRLGPPYTGRPGAGCRAMARSLLAQHLPPLVRQLGEWTSGLRVAAARGLHTTLVLAEEGAARHLKLLLPALCSAIADEELEVATHVMTSVHVLGAHVTPTDWLPRMLDTLSPPGAAPAAAATTTAGGAGPSLSLSQRTNTLVVLSGLLHAAGRARRELPPPLLARLAATLAEEPMLTAAAEHAGVRQQLLAVTANTLTLGGSACAAVALPLHLVLLLLYGCELAAAAAAAAPPPSPAAQAAAAAAAPPVGDAVLDSMSSLAAACGCGGGAAAAAAATADGAAALVDFHSDDLTALLFGEEAAVAAAARPPWRPRAGDASWQCVLRAMLLTASPPTLQRLAPALVASLQPVVADREREAGLRLALLQLLDSVLEDPRRGPALAVGGGQALISEVLMPPLVWQAGKTAAAVRFAAVTALATMLGRRLPRPEHVLAAIEGAGPGGAAAAAAAAPPSGHKATASGGGGGGDGSGFGLLPLLFSSLDEDWYTDIRLAACYVVEQLLEMVGPQLSDASRRAIYPELHKRLDDAHNAVRVAACGALRAFVSSAGAPYCDTNSGYLVAGVVIHMDDGDAAVQEAACGVLLAAAAVKPKVTAAEVRKVRDRFRSKHYCDRVLAACEEAAEAAAANRVA